MSPGKRPAVPWKVQLGDHAKEQLKTQQIGPRTGQLAMASAIPRLIVDPYDGVPLCGEYVGYWSMQGQGWDVKYVINNLDHVVVIKAFGQRDDS